MAHRGRPRKIAPTTTPTATASTQTAPKAAPTPSVSQTDKETPKPADALSDALRSPTDDIRKYLMVAARVAAADTVRTCQQPATVLRDAIKEGLLAYDILRELEGGATC